MRQKSRFIALLLAVNDQFHTLYYTQFLFFVWLAAARADSQVPPIFLDRLKARLRPLVPAPLSHGARVLFRSAGASGGDESASNRQFRTAIEAKMLHRKAAFHRSASGRVFASNE